MDNKENVQFKAVVFHEGDEENGEWFYNTTLPAAILKIKEMGKDPVKNFKMTISVYYQ